MDQRLLRCALLGTALLLSIAACSGAPGNVVAVSGRIEGDDSAVASKLPGRVLAVHVREGDTVAAGEVIATLDDAQARAAVDDAAARVSMAERQVPVLQAQLRQAQIGTQQAGVGASGDVSAAQSQVAAANSQLSQAQAAYNLAAYNEKISKSLYGTGDVSELQRNRAESEAQQAASALAAARQRAQAAQGELTASTANLSNAPMREQQAAAVSGQINQQGSAVSAAQANLDQARANLRDLTIRAPFAGTVLTRTAEPGEVLAAGTPVVTLLNLQKVYLRGFIPEGEIAKVKLGQSARVFLDDDPSHKNPIDAYVMRIDPDAMFTPENTYFQSDRVQQVFGVKLGLRGGFGNAKPGMPADGQILVGGSWQK
ncbi:MAG TPA: HlyD family efflux transporter periplasmic adaptor subunit [Candidatus Baltobacteraceae bacterium]|nr:HlyD family efflux transporter periplasmic adaptor subunit [Candidatus Baltobacteraceae bacterium]